jgi:hypothetical protein
MRVIFYVLHLLKQVHRRNHRRTGGYTVAIHGNARMLHVLPIGMWIMHSRHLGTDQA